MSKSKITLLKLQTIEYQDEKDLEHLVRRHREELTRVTENLRAPGCLALMQAIAYNLVHLARELKKVREEPPPPEPIGTKRATLTLLPGGKDNA